MNFLDISEEATGGVSSFLDLFPDFTEKKF